MQAISKILLGTIATAISLPGSYGVYLLVSPKSIKSKLERGGYKVLDTTKNPESETTNYDYSKWQEKIKEEEENRGWKDFAGWTQESSEEKEKINKLKTQCASKLKITKEENSFKDDLEKTKKYCAVAQSSI